MAFYWKEIFFYEVDDVNFFKSDDFFKTLYKKKQK